MSLLETEANEALEYAARCEDLERAAIAARRRSGRIAAAVLQKLLATQRRLRNDPSQDSSPQPAVGFLGYPPGYVPITHGGGTGSLAALATNEGSSRSMVDGNFHHRLPRPNDQTFDKSFNLADGHEARPRLGPHIPSQRGKAKSTVPFGSGSRAHPFSFSPVSSPTKGQQVSPSADATLDRPSRFFKSDTGPMKRASDEETVASSTRASVRRRISEDTGPGPVVAVNNLVSPSVRPHTPENNDVLVDITDTPAVSTLTTPSDSRPRMFAPDSDDEYAGAYTDFSDQELIDHFSFNDALEEHLARTTHHAACPEGCGCMIDNDYDIYEPPTP